MTYAEALRYFVTQKQLAEALDISQASVSVWRHNRIPPRRQYELEMITDGILKADPELRRRSA